MVIVYGTRLYGKVDAVPGLGHVATKFAHLYYIPLIPTGSWFVTAEDGDGWRGAEIGMSLKSVLVAWVRAFLFLVLIGGAFAAMLDHRDLASGILSAVVALGAVLASYAVPFVKNASYTRAKELGRECGLTEEGQISLGLSYGKIDEEEAAHQFGLLQQERAEAEHAAAVREALRREQRRARRLEERVKSSDVPVAELLVTRTRGALKFACPACNHATKVPAALAGKKGKCPKCKTALRVPARPRRAVAA